MRDRLVCLLIGYVLGCCLMAEVVVQLRMGKSAFALGNPGAANVAAHCGVKAGLLVLAGDLAKTALAAALCRVVLFPALGPLAVLYAGLGCAAGHNFPFWHQFHGGKGVTATCMAAVMFSPLAGLCSTLAGLLAVLCSGYLALGAAAIALCFPLLTGILTFGAEAFGLAAALGLLLLSRFFPAFRRIRRREEKRVNLINKCRKK